MSLLEGFNGPFVNLPPGMVDLEDYGSREAVRHSSGVQQSSGHSESGNAYWLTGTVNPADGLTKVLSEMVPLPRLLGVFRPLRPLRRAPFRFSLLLASLTIPIL